MRSANNLPCLQHDENPDGRIGYPYHKLELDSVRPLWHKSSYRSVYRVRVRGLEIEVS
jgi:hypothetical protein